MESRGITFENDIIRDVANELGYEEGQVAAVYDSMMRYIKYLAKFSNYCTIVIIYLGSIYLKEIYAKRANRYIQNPKYLKSLRSRYERMKNAKRKVTKPSKWSYYYQQYPKYWLNYYTDGKGVCEIEELQNRDI